MGARCGTEGAMTTHFPRLVEADTPWIPTSSVFSFRSPPPPYTRIPSSTKRSPASDTLEIEIPSAMSPTRLILSVNAGSSSIKLCLYSASFGSAPVSLVKSSVSGLTSPPAKFSYSNNANKRHTVEDRESADVTDQSSALRLFLGHFGQDESLKEHGTGEVELVVHRIVHGGLFRDAVVLNKEAIREIELLTDLAPLYGMRHVELCVERANIFFPSFVGITRLLWRWSSWPRTSCRGPLILRTSTRRSIREAYLLMSTPIRSTRRWRRRRRSGSMASTGSVIRSS